MTQILERRLDELLLEAPLRARVFSQFQIDYGCQQKISLAEACAQNQADPELVVAALDAQTQAATQAFLPMGLGALADEIVSRHHDKVREMGPRIQPLLNKVCDVHGAEAPFLYEIRSLFQALHGDLLMHMLKEEGVLFPYCKRLELAVESFQMHCGSIANPIRMMLFEHGEALMQTEQLSKLCEEFVPPTSACTSWRVLYAELQAYVEDLHLHMQLENNLLFPAALRSEENLKENIEEDTFN